MDQTLNTDIETKPVMIYQPEDEEQFDGYVAKINHNPANIIKRYIEVLKLKIDSINIPDPSWRFMLFTTRSRYCSQQLDAKYSAS